MTHKQYPIGNGFTAAATSGDVLAGIGSVKPIDAATVEGLLSIRIDGLEPPRTRQGIDAKNLADQFDAKPAKICKLRQAGGLDPARARG